jgi:hypothetical protein
MRPGLTKSERRTHILENVRNEVRNKNGAGRVNDISSSRALNRFRKAAKAFTTRATKSRATALETLVSEGIYTKSGRVSKNYR